MANLLPGSMDHGNLDRGRRSHPGSPHRRPPSSWPTANLASGWLQSLGTGQRALGPSSALTGPDSQVTIYGCSTRLGGQEARLTGGCLSAIHPAVWTPTRDWVASSHGSGRGPLDRCPVGAEDDLDVAPGGVGIGATLVRADHQVRGLGRRQVGGMQVQGHLQAKATVPGGAESNRPVDAASAAFGLVSRCPNLCQLTVALVPPGS
jgi:hypothetical protein